MVFVTSPMLRSAEMSVMRAVMFGRIRPIAIVGIGKKSHARDDDGLDVEPAGLHLVQLCERLGRLVGAGRIGSAGAHGRWLRRSGRSRRSQRQRACGGDILQARR